MNHPVPPSLPPFSRRRFLTTLTASTLLPTVATRALAAAAPRPVERGHSAPTPTCIHVFSKPLTTFSYADTAALLAEAGFGGIDFSVRRGGHVLPERVRDDLPRAVEAAHAAGLKVEMITTGIQRADEKYAADILETAAKLGVKYYRLGWFNYDPAAGIWKTIEHLRPVMRDLADMNRHYGVHGAYQNHSGLHVGAAMWDIYELVRDLDPQWIGCQFDIRHATTEGGESWPNSLRLLAPWIRCTDIKDFRWEQSPGHAKVEGTPLGQGIVDFARYFGLVRELNVSGPISVHLEYAPFEGGPKGISLAERRKLFAPALRADCDTLKRMRRAAGLD